MSTYKKSLYALNKFSENIVYRFGDEIREITLVEYLQQNPTHTEKDFKKYKAISDELFYTEDLADTRYNKKKLSIDGIGESDLPQSETTLDKLVKAEDEKRVINATYSLLEGKNLTEIQKRRFILHFYQNKSLREIAKLEGVKHTPVYRSIQYATKKLKDFFDNEG